MTGRSIVIASALGLAVAPIAANAAQRVSAPVTGENALKGQGTLFFLAGIAAVALAIVLLPEDQPASP